MVLKIFGYGVAATFVSGLLFQIWNCHNTVEDMEQEIKELETVVQQKKIKISSLNGNLEKIQNELQDQNQEIEKWRQEAKEQELKADKRISDLKEEFKNKTPIDTEKPEELNQWIDNLFE